MLLTFHQAQAQQRKAMDKLPVFEITALDGKVSKSDSLPMEPNWVLVYVRPNCRACEAIFRELGGSSFGGPRQRDARALSISKAGPAPATQPQNTYFARVADAQRKVIVVVGGASVADVREMSAQMPWIPQGSWYADPSRQIASKLGFQAAPVIAGIKNGSVKWSYTGLPPQGMPLRALMSSWHEQHVGKPTAKPLTRPSGPPPPTSKP
jgi:hypothetical protein